MKPISYLESPFREKFGVPRQSLLVDVLCQMKFPKDDFYLEAFRGIDSFTHLWLIFEFHLIPKDSARALVRPPRFEAKKKMGVFATRSPHRPNKLGLSVVQFEKLEILSDTVILWVRGADLVDKTPIYDIKPYIPYADSIPHARARYFEDAPVKINVQWAVDFNQLEATEKTLVEAIVGLDPRPGFDKDSLDAYGVSFGGWNIRFKKQKSEFLITSLTKE